MRILLSLLLSASSLFAQADYSTLLLLNTGGGAACSTSLTDLPSSLGLLEGFETPTSGYEEAWTLVTGTVSPYTDTSSLTTGKPVGACDRAFSVTADASENSAYFDFGSSQSSPVDIYFYLYPTTIEDGNVHAILQLGSSPAGLQSGAVYNLIQLRNNGGTHEVRGLGINQSAWITVTLNSWNKIKLHLDSTSTTSSYLEVNDGGTSNTFDSDDGTWRYVIIGSERTAGTGTTGTLYFDLVTAD